MSSPDYKYRVNKPMQVLKQLEPRARKPKKKPKFCKRLKGDHDYRFYELRWKVWLDFKCIGCGKKSYIIKPEPAEDPYMGLHLWRKKEYTAKDLEFINAYQGDKQIFYA